MRHFSITAAFFLLCAPAFLHAQDEAQDPNQDIPLGDLARQMRKSKPFEQTDVIDNDNIVPLMDKAETERLEGMPVSVVHRGIFTTVSPDGSCSLSFDARSIAPASVGYIAIDLPQNELAKLDGPAAIRDGQLEVSVHNGTPWELREVVVGVTIRQAVAQPAEYRFATMEVGSALSTSSQKLADPTLIFHLKGTGAPDSTTTFRADVGGFPQAQDWHWTIIGARGIPPAAQPALAVARSEPTTAPPSAAIPPSSLARTGEENHSLVSPDISQSGTAISEKH